MSKKKSPAFRIHNFLFLFEIAFGLFFYLTKLSITRNVKIVVTETLPVTSDDSSKLENILFFLVCSYLSFLFLLKVIFPLGIVLSQHLRVLMYSIVILHNLIFMCNIDNN